MKEIKIRYIFEDDVGKKHILTETIEEIEAHTDITRNIEKGWRLIARNLYVGLHDKNDREVYQGDNVEKVGIGKGVVVFGEYIIGKDSWGLPIITQGFAIEWDDGSGYCELNKETSVEIIGNIYEPKLKETENEQH